MRFWKTRIFSLVALSAMVGSCGYIAHETYFIATDSFVAPAILGPDNDLVLDSKIKLSQILLEKGKAESDLEEANADLEAGQKAIARLNELKIFASQALSWTKTTTGQQVVTGNTDLTALATQRDTLTQMLERQTALTEAAQRNLEAGLIQKPDYEREVQALDAARLALVENDRSKLQTNLLLNTAALGQQSLYSKGSMPMPEQVMSADQLVRIECQMLETEAEMRAKTAAKRSLELELAKINTLESELRARPIFRAVETNVDVAFVPYTQIKGVMPGTRVMNCVWGIFLCKDVGRVQEVISGETVLTDPWGSQARGQFITLEVQDRLSMQSKVLRIRNNGSVPVMLMTKK
jgi:hypothetical protein